MYIFTAQSTAMINLNTSYGTLSCDKVPEGVGNFGAGAVGNHRENYTRNPFIKEYSRISQY